MISGSAFQELGTVIDELEAREMTVLDVAADRGSLVSDGTLSVELTVSLDSLSGFATEENITIVSADGTDDRVTTTFTIEIPVDEDGSLASSLSEDKQVDVSGTDSGGDEQGSSDAETLARQPGDDDDDVPYYKNYELLKEVYETHDTFAEMTEALGVDVTPATVREHMVNHGIHPTSSDDEDDEGDSDVDAQDDGDARSVTLEADGYGLPDSVSMDSLVHAVHRSRTLYEAQQALDLDRSTTREILTDLNLLDMVMSRLPDEGTSDIDEVVDRIHSASTA
jgi:hypothetical protein